MCIAYSTIAAQFGIALIYLIYDDIMLLFIDDNISYVQKF